jgi:lysophospholipase L1-like esterase
MVPCPRPAGAEGRRASGLPRLGPDPRPAFAQDARRLNDVLRANRGSRFRLVRPNGPYVDGVHLTAAGYRLKARRFAAAARGC